MNAITRAEKLDRELAYLTTARDIGTELIRQPLTALLIAALCAKGAQKLEMLTAAEANLLITGLFGVETLKTLQPVAGSLANTALTAATTTAALAYTVPKIATAVRTVKTGIAASTAAQALKPALTVGSRLLPAAGAAVLAAEAIPLIKKNVPNAMDELVKLGNLKLTLDEWKRLPWWKRIFVRRPKA